MKKKYESMASTPVFTISKGVGGRFLTKQDARIELALIIDEDTSAEELRQAWSEIDYLRENLRKIQGNDMNRLPRSLLHNYSQLKAHGWSYNAIAMDINFDCFVNLCIAAGDAASLGDPRRSASYIGAVHLLRAMRIKDQDILSWLTVGLKEIKDGKAPWGPESGPVDGLRVRDSLRQWKRELDKGRVIIKRPRNMNMRLQISYRNWIKATLKGPSSLLKILFRDNGINLKNSVQRLSRRQVTLGLFT